MKTGNILLCLLVSVLFPSSDAYLVSTRRTPATQKIRLSGNARSSLTLPALLVDTDRSRGDNEDEYKGGPASLEWVSVGISAVYLAHFASLYTQLPGLFGQTGLLPIVKRVASIDSDLWALNMLTDKTGITPELGLELFGVMGIVVSAAQLIFGQKLRRGPAGVFAYGLLWVLWHDLVFSGGRFMEYQMDLLLLDAAPLTLLSATGALPEASIFGYRWLLSRLYIGAGAVKLLSCDDSWRSLSAVHWHFQSQPLPNPVGAWAFLHMPTTVSDALTWITLVVEMAAPFLFLAPSPTVRRIAFVIHVALMVGIASFGNFGTLQILLIVIGFALLDDLPVGDKAIDPTRKSTMSFEAGDSPNYSDLSSAAITTVSVTLAIGGASWAIGDIGARCLDTLALEPLIYGLVALGAAVAILPLFSILSSATSITAASSLAILAGSASIMAGPLGVYLPAFDMLNFGAVPYGLFATITGVGGRPVAAIEAAQSPEGPWAYIPLLYQVNDPLAALPLIFPHFPRVDWTLWFLPAGEGGAWIARFFNGITIDDPAVVHLLDGRKFHKAFPREPPAIVRVVPRKYELDPVAKVWSTSDDQRYAKYAKSPVLATFSRGDLPRAIIADPLPWPSTPLLRPLADSGRPEYFVWGCLSTAEGARRAIDVHQRWKEEKESQ